MTAHFWLAHPIEKVGWRGFGPCFSIGVECSFLSHADRSEAAASAAGERREGAVGFSRATHLDKAFG